MSKELFDVKNQVKEEIFPVQDLHHVELYVGNAKQAAYFYCKAYGFKIIGYQGLETGCRDRVSYVLEQGAIRFVVTGSLQNDTDIAEFVKLHGEGAKDIALKVSNVDEAYQGAVQRGAIVIKEPWTESDGNGIVKKAIVGTYGDTIHTLIDKTDYKGPFLPGYQVSDFQVDSTATGLVGIDHIVGNVERMDEWTEYYAKVFGFNVMKHFDDDDISTEYSALMSKVMTNGTGRIKFPINEPAEGKRKSQIQEYLDFYYGPGVQHLALLTNDIISTVNALKANGVEFLCTPATYYEELTDRVGKIDEDLKKIQELNILVDCDDEGYLLQIFTKPVVDRPTLFIEIIQRKGALGFGDGNFKALFESIEREQERRGNI
ncbi:4-hydroxyphenylpyruvate dioxygenase [Aneurinibacillus tyrosinisolvens]|uniref:4-hydroxyphenylpyruvate dioxygenase n=1 Tax=Aneurinibacillus tyrosinisolvens TaxID=1443435 RepID=UPI00063F6608|nr:4-hydroxyphenylpyruvate dioxygenase [Aneurinibacillus tyrosinisolvens]